MSNTIEVKKSSLSYKKIKNKQQLIEVTKSHQNDVKNGIEWFIDKLREAANKHDHTKLQNIDLFFEALKSDFRDNR